MYKKIIYPIKYLWSIQAHVIKNWGAVKTLRKCSLPTCLLWACLGTEKSKTEGKMRRREGENVVIKI